MSQELFFETITSQEIDQSTRPMGTLCSSCVTMLQQTLLLNAPAARLVAVPAFLVPLIPIPTLIPFEDSLLLTHKIMDDITHAFPFLGCQ